MPGNRITDLQIIEARHWSPAMPRVDEQATLDPETPLRPRRPRWGNTPPINAHPHDRARWCGSRFARPSPKRALPMRIAMPCPLPRETIDGLAHPNHDVLDAATTCILGALPNRPAMPAAYVAPVAPVKEYSAPTFVAINTYRAPSLVTGKPFELADLRVDRLSFPLLFGRNAGVEHHTQMVTRNVLHRWC